MALKKRTLRTLMIVVMALVLGVVAYWANRSGWLVAFNAPAEIKAGPPGGMATAVEVVQIQPMRVNDEATAVGTLKSMDSVVLRPEIAGRIAAIRFADGQSVKRGDVLILLDAAIQAAEAEQARANLGLAEANFRRSEDLFKKQFISTRARDEAAAQLKVQAAALALAEAKLAKTVLRAPFAGVVGLRGVSVGDYVKDGQELVNVESVQTLKVDFKLPENLMTRLQRGQVVTVTSDALPGKSFASKVEAIDPLLDTGGRALSVRARLDNTGAVLKPGQFVRVSVRFGSREQVLMVPEQAITPSAKGASVFKVVDGKAVMTPVKTGLRQNALLEISQGLAAGDTVVIAGQLKLRDGAAVKVAEAPRAGVSGIQGMASGAAGAVSDRQGMSNMAGGSASAGAASGMQGMAGMTAPAASTAPASTPTVSGASASDKKPGQGS